MNVMCNSWESKLLLLLNIKFLAKSYQFRTGQDIHQETAFSVVLLRYFIVYIQLTSEYVLWGPTSDWNWSLLGSSFTNRD